MKIHLTDQHQEAQKAPWSKEMRNRINEVGIILHLFTCLLWERIPMSTVNTSYCVKPSLPDRCHKKTLHHHVKTQYETKDFLDKSLL